MARTVYLDTPLKKEDIESLEIDDTVYISGDLYTMMYTDHFTRIMEMIDRGEALPMDLKGGIMYHTGTIFRRRADGNYDFRAIGTTTSSKFNPYTADFIRKTGIRAVMGKGGMDKATLQAMEECGCVYLALAGGCAAIYTEKVECLKNEYWSETHNSWADNMLRLKVKNYGPMFVAMDAHGNSIYEDIVQQVQKNRDAIYRTLDIKA